LRASTAGAAWPASGRSSTQRSSLVQRSSDSRSRASCFAQREELSGGRFGLTVTSQQLIDLFP
jgi:hypothetical protein